MFVVANIWRHPDVLQKVCGQVNVVHPDGGILADTKKKCAPTPWKDVEEP